VTLAVDAFSAWAVGGIASPVGFVLLRMYDLVEQLEVEDVGSASVASGGAEKCEIDETCCIVVDAL
jgi:hypothetical protein